MMTVVLFFHVPLTLAAAFAFHVCLSPPIGALPLPSPDGDESASESGKRQTRIYTTARFMTVVLTKGFYWASALTDILVLIAPHVPTSPESIPTPSSIPPILHLSWTQLATLLPSKAPVSLLTSAGAALALTGTLLRIRAYRALGHFYACPPGPEPCPGPRTGPGSHAAQSARHGHALITTGPYALIRHPGYSGLILSAIGFVMLQWGNGCGATRWEGIDVGVGVSRLGGAMRAVALGCAVLGAVGSIGRIESEERALRGRFKAEWELWAERVRYRLVPGVY